VKLFVAAWVFGLVAASASAAPETLGSGGAQPAVPAACLASWSPVAMKPVPSRDLVWGVAGVSASDVWAVGDAVNPSWSSPVAVIEHWNGSSWSLVPTTIPGTWDSVLSDVAALSATDAWAVGQWWEQGGPGGGSLIVHWDGSAWTVVPNPAPAAASELHSVTAISADDVWAAGFQYAQGRRLTLLLHWDGQQWTQVPSPNPSSGNNRLWAVAAVDGADVWAAGDAESPSNYQPLAEHWAGAAWDVVPTPTVDGTSLQALEALGPNDVWGVGNRGPNGDPLALHWDGSNWTSVPAAALGTNIGAFNGVAALGPLDIWAAGGDRVPLFAHWDGSSWLSIPTASTGRFQDVLGLPASDTVWAVGQSAPYFDSTHSKPISWRVCPVQVSDSGVTPTAANANKGAMALWHFAPSNIDAHTLSDGSGLQLFASGPNAPGTYYGFTFVAAGLYPVLDNGSPRGSVSVPLTRSPTSGQQSTTFTITWAVGALPSGDVCDIQIKRPGSTGFVSWQNAMSATQATFTPDAGPGKYQFRARLRNPVSGAASGYSTAKAITVT
jgi:hypothetical protein